MSRPRVPIVQIGGERISDVRIRTRCSFEQGLLDVSGEIGPLLKHRTAEKLLRCCHTARFFQ